ncbi:PucR family transcriptional regulator [Nocardioides eburneiflavus]|uniref:PucR family transcriptional regulator n=1 Tax=Nocardioides eburneiflavus TaxID=2518372 RepID=A0A4Z1CJE2_9ACTN|nr:PucR family transcriptional regulator [Nocardioides eburneiflavus]TGN63953.1 PucR family transcriptional regulator [Nocardioides eburneiflavus]
MLIPLTEVLALPSFRAAGVRVLVGDPDPVLVRWVHSSEVYEMGALLAGGEVLLTTGLGLHGRTPEHLAAYVEQLADAGLAALALELGRTFFEVPPAILEAAGRRHLVVLGLTQVVPFERMVEDFHELVVRRRTHAGGGAAWEDLAQVVVDGRGLRALLDEVSRAAGCEVELRDRDDQLVERSTIASVAEEARVAEPVRGPAGVVGTVHLLGAPTRQRRRVAGQAAVAVALELGRAGSLGHRPSPSQSLVSDLCAATPMPGTEVTDRLADLGWPPPDGRGWQAVAVAVEPGTALADVVPAVEHALRGVATPVLAGVAGSRVVAVVRGWSRPGLTRAALTDAYAVLGRRLAADASGASPAGASSDPAAPALVVAGPLVGDPAELGPALGTARELLELARRTGRRDGVLLARDLAAPHLLSAVGPAVWAGVAEEQVGALIAHDSRHRTELLRTLDTYLALGTSKAAAATALGIRRQSLYDRLERIERLLGVDVDDADQQLGLRLGLLAWRLRTGIDPRVGFGG